MTATIGFLSRWRSGEVELRVGLLFAACGMCGTPAGAWAASLLPDRIVLGMFAILMGTVAVLMWRRARSTAEADSTAIARADHSACQRTPEGRLLLTSRCTRLLAAIGLGTGVLSGMFGVGGGFIIVPALTTFSGMSLSRAVGTSLLVIALISGAGLASSILSGTTVDLTIAGPFIAGGAAGLLAGQSLARHLSSAALNRSFAVVIAAVSLFVILRTL
jgi:uncharacterized membrane protein YfcA